MTCLLIITAGLAQFYDPQKEDEQLEAKMSAAETEKHHKLLQEFHVFRHKYILVYLIIMLADWMQGTHMYTLYLSYGVNISALFLTGFLSGAIFAPFLGSFVDKFGRKRSWRKATMRKRRKWKRGKHKLTNGITKSVLFNVFYPRE